MELTATTGILTDEACLGILTGLGKELHPAGPISGPLTPVPKSGARKLLQRHPSGLNRRERRASLQSPSTQAETSSQGEPSCDPWLDGQPMTEAELEKAAKEEATLRAAPFGRRSSPGRRVRLAAAGLGETSKDSKPAKWDSGLKKMEEALEDEAEAAKIGGVWQSDGSRHSIGRKVNEGARARVAPRDGRPTLRMAYLFSGPQRKSSIAHHLHQLCAKAGFGLEVDEIDILVGGKQHDMLDSEAQEAIMARIAAGDYDIVVMSPPCATWSRARLSNHKGPGPVRDRDHPWGIPHLRYEWMKKSAAEGNVFIHFAIRTIATCQAAKRRGFRVMTILEHPEDLGRCPKGVPASIWQLKELRSAYAEFPHVSVAGHQCQFGLDAPKPTRLYSDIVSLLAFGYGG